MTTDGDANMVGLDGVGFLAGLTRGDLDLGWRKDGSVAAEEVDTLPVPVGLVDATEPLNVSVTLGFEGGPIELWLVETFELVAGGLTKLVGKVCGVPHQLLWNAS